MYRDTASFKSSTIIILGAVKRMLWVSFIIILLIFFSEYAIEVTAGIWAMDLKAWWYDFIFYKKINWVLATSLYITVIMAAWTLGKPLKGPGTGWPGQIIRIVLVQTVSHILYWKYLIRVCFDDNGLWGLEWSYTDLYGSIENAEWISCGVILSMMLIGTMFTKMDIFIKDHTKKHIMRKLLDEKDEWTQNLDEVFTLFLVWPGMPLISDISGWFVLGLLGIFEGIFIFRWFHKKRRFCERLLSYYKQGQDPNHMTVAACELGNSDWSFVSDILLEHSVYLNLVERNHILILPEIFNLENMYDQVCHRDVVLDIYKEKKAASALSEKNGKIYGDQNKEIYGNQDQNVVFRIAYCSEADWLSFLKPGYDWVFTDWGLLFQKLVDIKAMIFYKKEQYKIIAQLKLDAGNGDNPILDELRLFKNYYMKSDNLFSVFDYSIKWAEIINYFYTLILIALLDIDLNKMTGDFRAYVTYADFGKWRNLRTHILGRKNIGKYIKSCEKTETLEKLNLYKKLLNRWITDSHVMECYNTLWLSISGQENCFDWKHHRYTNADLLDRMVRIRNYTRGHGVYTFEVSGDINTALVTILVYLVSELVNSGLLKTDMHNLENNGWLAVSGGDRYFCYTVETCHREVEYYCFQKGITLRIPEGVSDEKLE